MRLAAIDIGTNSIHMIVVNVRPDLSFEVIDREKDMVRLGAGGLDGRSITPTAMAAALQTLAKFKRLAESHKVDEIVAAATSATREAENGGDFIGEVRRLTGIRIRVISGAEEARLIHLAAGYGVDIGASTGVVVDIGGGSVEVTLGNATQMVLGRSFKVGVIRLTERFVKSDPLAGRDERRIVKHLSREMGSYLDQVAKRGYDRVIGTSGTILSLGALASSEESSSIEELRNRRVSAKALHRLRKRLVSLSLEERLAMPGLDPRRADLSVGGLRPLRHDHPASRRRRIHPVRPGPARRARARLHPPQQRPDPQGRALPGCATAQRHRTGGTVRLLARPRPAGRQARAHDLRSDPERPRPFGQGTRLARVRGAAARHRRAHQLRAAPPPFLLLDQERRPARVRPGGNRSHRPDRPLPPPGHAEEVARGVSRSRRLETPRRQGDVGHGQTRGRTRPQPFTGAAGAGPLSPRRRLPGAPPHRRGCRAGIVGRAPARRAARRHSG